MVAGTALVEITDECDHSSAEALHAAIVVPLTQSEGVDRLLIDLAHCRYLDSTALSAFHTALKILPCDGWLGFIHPSADISRLLDITGLAPGDRIKCFDSREAALAFVSHALEP